MGPPRHIGAPLNVTSGSLEQWGYQHYNVVCQPLVGGLPSLAPPLPVCNSHILLWTFSLQTAQITTNRRSQISM